LGKSGDFLCNWAIRSNSNIINRSLIGGIPGFAPSYPEGPTWPNLPGFWFRFNIFWPNVAFESAFSAFFFDCKVVNQQLSGA
jgi:hypothetical protein